MNTTEMYIRINKLREYLNRRKSLDSVGLETARMVLEDYDKMRIGLSVMVGELNCQKTVSAKKMISNITDILWEETS